MIPSRLRLGLCVAAFTPFLAFVAPSSAAGAGNSFDRAWGQDVGGTGVAVCTVAASCQAGVSGGLGGQFSAAGLIASDGAGDVYVADRGRVEKFDSSGAFLLAWGKDVGGAGVGVCTVAANCQAGTPGSRGGEFAVNGPDGVATDPAGNVYVTEFYGNRVQKFTSSGVFLFAWGKDVGGPGSDLCTTAASCQAGGPGTPGGQFFSPEDVATDAAGNVYVTDTNNLRVQKFTSSGSFVLAWGADVGAAGTPVCTTASTCRVGTRGTSGDGFSNPTGLATDAAGHVYVTDQNLFRVTQFNSSGAFLRAWGKDVGGPGIGTCTAAASCQSGSRGAQGVEFDANGPGGIATDAAGNVYVVNAAAGGRVVEFDASGAFVQAWGKDVGGLGLAVCTVAANCQTGSAGVLGGEFNSPAGVATDSAGSVYVAEFNNQRVQKFVSAAPVAQRTLTVTVTGSGNVTGAGIDCGGAGHATCTTTVADGSSITLTAAPAASFTGFTGGGCGAGNPCTVVMNADITVAATFSEAPSATVTTPTDGATYPSGAVVNASYSCSPGANGGVLKPGTAGCSGPVADGTPISTGAAGPHTFAVTATDTDGQTATTTVNYTVASPTGPPTASVTTPADGATYAVGSVVDASYSCSPGVNGGALKAGAAGCSGPVPSGTAIDTATAGPHTFAVTATDTDSQTGTATVSYTVAAAPPGPPGPPAPAPGPPSVTVTAPADGASYPLGATVKADYACLPGANGGVLRGAPAGCLGPVAIASPIDTATAGPHTFAVTATDTDGQTATTTVRYTVAAQPGPPSVTVTTPVDGASYYLASVVKASYTCTPGANGGVLKPGTAGCSAPVPSGSPIDTVGYGDHTFTVTATDTDGQTATITRHYGLDYSIKYPTPVRPQRPVILASPVVDIRVTGIEVTQAIQAVTCNCAGTLPNRVDPFGKSPGRATYEGVTMAAGKYTVVRVFAHVTGVSNPAATSLRGATATLRVFDGQEREILAPLSPDISPTALTRPDCIACVTEAERATASSGFLFVIPWDATYHRTLSFRATVSPPTGLAAPVQCGGCNANVFTLRGVPFATTANVDIYPIPLTVGGVQTSRTVDQVFGSAQTVLPVNVNIYPYETPLAVDGLNDAQAAAAVYLRALRDGRTNAQYPIGVFADGALQNRALNSSGGLSLSGRVLYNPQRLFSLPTPPISVVADDRPLTSVMHEIGHGLGLVHADTGSLVPGSPPTATGPHPDGTPDCTGNSGGQIGEAWPPDNKGLLQGVGFDLRNWTARILDEGHPAANSYYDFMSYCGNGSVAQIEADHWISVRNWSRLIAFQPPPQTLPTVVRSEAVAQAAGDAQVLVLATADATGKTSIFDIAPGLQTGAQPTTGSPYRIDLRDHAGNTLASAVPATTNVHSDGQPPAVLLEATLPFDPSAASVVISADGVELSRRTRSVNAPEVFILSPGPGTRVGHNPTTLVRWAASDVDGDPLTSAVDYSADGGVHWKVVADGVHGTSVSVPSRLLNTSADARIRVRVSDGFNATTAVSGALRAAGAPPAVHIIGGTAGGRVQADARLLLRGSAYDDAGHKLTGASLRWYAGRRLLGRGELLTAKGLPAGTTAIRLVANDAHGRIAQTLLPLKVLPARPVFLTARVPKRVAPTARQVRIVVAANVPAVLTIAGARYAINRTPRTLTLTITRGRTPLQLAYVLSSPGGVTRGTYIAIR
jgi:hypothetical protein